VRLSDRIFRGGHLSERALVEALTGGERPAHLDRCDLCAERAVALSRWLDDIRATGVATADAAFPPERLASQQAQILRRLEQLDQPARVIAFPSHARLSQRDAGDRRVAPGWVGVAAAAGLVLGVVGGQLSARMGSPMTPALPPAEVAQPQAASPVAMTDTATPSMRSLGSLLDMDFDTPVKSLELVDDLTPRLMTPASLGPGR
jgi:hypothetical protein